MSEALILACSAAKRRPEALPWHLTDTLDGDGVPQAVAPAVLVYDGPHWRILRRHNPKVAVFVLSGKWGLIQGYALIPHYDRPMPQEPRVHRGGGQ